MEISRPFEQHLHVGLDVGRLEGLVDVLDHLGEVGDHELEDEDEAEALGEDVVEANHVLAVQGLKSDWLAR